MSREREREREREQACGITCTGVYGKSVLFLMYWTLTENSTVWILYLD